MTDSQCAASDNDIRDIVSGALTGQNVPNSTFLRDKLLFHPTNAASTFTEAQQRGTGAYNEMVRLTFPGTCIRPPYGRIHPASFNTTFREQFYPLWKTDYREESLWGYCENASASLHGETTAVPSYIHCANDPLTLSQRNAFCEKRDAQIQMLGLAINGFDIDSLCIQKPSPVHMWDVVCVLVPEANINYGEFIAALREKYILANITLLLAPFNQTLVSKLTPRSFTVDIAQSAPTEKLLTMSQKPTTPIVDTNGTFLQNMTIFNLLADYAHYSQSLGSDITTIISETRILFTDWIERLLTEFTTCTPHVPYPRRAPGTPTETGIMVHSECVQLDMSWPVLNLDLVLSSGVNVHIAPLSTHTPFVIQPVVEGTRRRARTSVNTPQTCWAFVASGCSLSFVEGVVFDMSACSLAIDSVHAQIDGRGAARVPVVVKTAQVQLTDVLDFDVDSPFSKTMMDVIYSNSSAPLATRFAQNLTLQNAVLYSDGALFIITGLPINPVKLDVFRVSCAYIDVTPLHNFESTIDDDVNITRAGHMLTQIRRAGAFSAYYREANTTATFFVKSLNASVNTSGNRLVLLFPLVCDNTHVPTKNIVVHTPSSLYPVDACDKPPSLTQEQNATRLTLFNMSQYTSEFSGTELAGITPPLIPREPHVLSQIIVLFIADSILIFFLLRRSRKSYRQRAEPDSL